MTILVLFSNILIYRANAPFPSRYSAVIVCGANKLIETHGVTSLKMIYCTYCYSNLSLIAFQLQLIYKLYDLFIV
jgi:hypothetical protein